MNHQNRRSYGSDHGNGGISNKNNGVSSNLSSGNNEKITSLRYPPRRQGDVEEDERYFIISDIIMDFNRKATFTQQFSLNEIQVLP
ncbi:hypothetical protein GLOIN_2v1774380 [Rhizophagus irregularis DAOM 181602=DAOM 197198]|nr:hypothetical protein GLOIN_2v1774380 [Rhizophagus irregularis DAOM 181602=DAOM 197198]CAB4490845.1 unnamed protein product [Rhizophagus irregularis]CAG8619966.1 474_t:CDS:2 [Rhizophagus irregularis]